MALRAAMTGHLVLGTVHARDSFTVPQRLSDLGIGPSVLSGNLIASIAQRLVRRLCEACRQLKIVSSEDRKNYSLPESITHIYQADSCPSCHQTGYCGREAVAEVILFNEELSALVAEGGAQTSLRKACKHRGVSTLWDHGIKKVLAGKTTFAEIDRVIGTDA
jgi:type II secretory ATPase GspE/PulE/Tfp pilus assembly ATPase PilB-like protein